MVENRDHVRLHQVHVRLRLYFARAPSTISSQESVLTAVDLDAFGATMNHAEVLALSCARRADRPVSVCQRMEMWAGQMTCVQYLRTGMRFPRYWSRSLKHLCGR